MSTHVQHIYNPIYLPLQLMALLLLLLQDLEILKGYVAGFDGILGHECVARVLECASRPDLVGTEPMHASLAASCRSSHPCVSFTLRRAHARCHHKHPTASLSVEYDASNPCGCLQELA